MKQFSLAMALLSLALTLGACSTAPYKGAVEKFATASATATAATNAELESTISESRADAATSGTMQLQALKWQLEKAPECDQLIFPKPARQPPFDTISEADLIAACNLYQRGVPTNAVVAKFEAELYRIDIDKARKVAGALTDYADGLQAIVNAEDYDALRKAVSGMGSSLASVATLAGPKGAAAGAVIQPAIRIVGEIGIYGLEHRRWSVIRKVVPETDAAVALLSTRLDEAIKSLRMARLAAANSVMTSTQLAWNRGQRDRVTAKAVTEAALQYRMLARFTYLRPLPFSKLAEAHAALVKVVKKNATSEQIDEFFKRLGELEAAVKDLKAVIEQLGEG